MAEKSYPTDEHGMEIRSTAAKWIAPEPAPEDLTRVVVGPQPKDYVYADPASLFALERLMAHMREVGKGKFVKSKCQGFKPFVKQLAEQAWDYWPVGGYVMRITHTPGERAAEPVAEAPAAMPAETPPAAAAVQSELEFPAPDLVDDSDEFWNEEGESETEALVSAPANPVPDALEATAEDLQAWSEAEAPVPTPDFS